MHPAPVCADSFGLVGGQLNVAEQYAGRLSVATFVLPCLYYGLAQEVYRVQPQISCYAGEPETYSFADLVTATRHATEDWVPGSFRLHCLSRVQFEEQVRSGALDGCRVLVDLDMDYFGTSGEMRGYGYLALPQRGQPVATSFRRPVLAGSIWQGAIRSWPRRGGTRCRRTRPRSRSSSIPPVRKIGS